MNALTISERDALLHESALRGDHMDFWRHVDALKSAVAERIRDQQKLMTTTALAKHKRQSA